MGRPRSGAATAKRPKQTKAAVAESAAARVTLQAKNGEPIVVRKRTPANDAPPKAAIIVAPAMATPSGFYASFAEWLANEGYAVYTFDYQGYGESAVGPLKDVKADFLMWASDAQVVAEWVKTDSPELELIWVAHSLGGQVMPFASTKDGQMLPDRAILVAVGTGYWGNAEGRDRFLAPLLWYAISPITTKIFGYYPGAKLGIFGDIPAPVMRQWAKWCRNREYMWGVQPELIDTYARVDIPVTTVSLTDDETMSPTATAHLESYFTGTTINSLLINPKDYGLEKIGHMAFFRPKCQPVWERVLTPLLESSPAGEL